MVTRLEYLVYHNDNWHIAHAGVMTDFTDEQNGKPLRLAWFGQNDRFIAFDHQDPIVRPLPDLEE